MGLHLLMVDAILAQLKRAGFRAVFADGHGPSRGSWVENLAERQTRFGLKLFGVTKDVAPKWKSQVDHAGRNETSLMMHFRPELWTSLSSRREKQPVKGSEARTPAMRPPLSARNVCRSR